MCRHLAYLGPAATLREVLVEPEHGLYRQSWAPRKQRHGTVNADGFGVGWYAPGDPQPARYRQAKPIWADQSFGDIARVTWTPALLAAVRCATTGTGAGADAAAPFAAGRWLFSHNGALGGWPDAAAGLAAALPAGDLLALEARSDSALIWALVKAQLRDGADPGSALAATVTLLNSERVPGRYNFLLTDGEVIAATAAGETLCYQADGTRVVVASEPCDDAPGWTWVPGGSVLTAAAAGEVDVSPLTAAHTDS
jgi:gamma-glutamyl hercynylcysteine S-oxide hydrolase